MLFFSVYMMSIGLSVVFIADCLRHPNTMTSITDPNMSDRFTSAMEEIHNKQLKTYGEIIDATTELCQSHRQFVKSALGMFKTLLLLLHLTI